MAAELIEKRFRRALDELVTGLKEDRSVLAAILCGSMAHDTVWARSDIDLVLVTIDDRKVEQRDDALYADGVNVHANLTSRAQFRQTHSFTNPFFGVWRRCRYIGLQTCRNGTRSCRV